MSRELGCAAGLFGVPVLPQKLATQELQGIPWMRACMILNVIEYNI